MNRFTRFHIQADPFFGPGISLRCAIIDVDREIVEEVETLQFTKHKAGMYRPVDSEPMLRLTPEEAKGLMDGLWNAGIRPSDEFGTTGHLAATQKHLQDMRTLVFHKEGIKP